MGEQLRLCLLQRRVFELSVPERELTAIRWQGCWRTAFPRAHWPDVHRVLSRCPTPNSPIASHRRLIRATASIVDNMSDNAGSAVFADFGLQRRSGGRELMHFSESREPHIVWDRCANGIRPHDLPLFVHSLGCRDPVHPHGPVLLPLDLFYRTVKPHNLNSSQISELVTTNRAPCASKS